MDLERPRAENPNELRQKGVDALVELQRRGRHDRDGLVIHERGVEELRAFGAALRVRPGGQVLQQGNLEENLFEAEPDLQVLRAEA